MDYPLISPRPPHKILMYTLLYLKWITNKGASQVAPLSVNRLGRRDLQELEAGNWAWAQRSLLGAWKGEQLRGTEWKCRRKRGKCEQIKQAELGADAVFGRKGTPGVGLQTNVLIPASRD